VGLRSFLLGDFHVCLAECLGNSLLADTLRDFTARTTLIAMLYQSTHDAAQSCEDHVQIVQALEKGDLAKAEKLMQAHIGSVQAALKCRPRGDSDPLRSCAARWPAACNKPRRPACPKPPAASRPCRGQTHRRFFDLPRSPAMNFLQQTPTLFRPCRSRRAGRHRRPCADRAGRHHEGQEIKIAIPTDFPPYGWSAPT
jgi:hypothetical protein